MADRRFLVIGLYLATPLLILASVFFRVPRVDIELNMVAPVVTFQTDEAFRGDAVPTNLTFRDWDLRADTIHESSNTDNLRLALEYAPPRTVYRFGDLDYSSGRAKTLFEIAGPSDAAVNATVIRDGVPVDSLQIQRHPVESNWTFQGEPIVKPTSFALAAMPVRDLYMFPPDPHVGGQPLAAIALDTLSHKMLLESAWVQHATLTVTSLKSRPTHEFVDGDALVLLGTRGRILRATIDSENVHIAFVGSVTDVLTTLHSKEKSLMPTLYEYLSAQSILIVTFSLTTTVGALVLAVLRWWPSAT